MGVLEIQNSDEEIMIRLSKKFMDKQRLMQLIENLKLEDMINRADFDEEIELIGKEIKESWWQNNKEKFLQ